MYVVTLLLEYMDFGIIAKYFLCLLYVTVLLEYIDLPHSEKFWPVENFAD